MDAKFDNIDDVVTKFGSTICMYKGSPVRIEMIQHSNKNIGSFRLIAKVYGKGPLVEFEIDDPDFNYRDFNIGYSNGSVATAWWYRRPYKQYHQGLKRNQLSYICSVPAYKDSFEFGFNRMYSDMLSNVYPNIEACQKALKDGAHSMAFHRDFALSFDQLHNDYILEYQGRHVGISSNLKNFKLAPRYQHLHEALDEIVNKEKAYA